MTAARAVASSFSASQILASPVQVVVDRVEVVRTVERDDAQGAVGLDVDFVWHSIQFPRLIALPIEDPRGDDVLLNLAGAAHTLCARLYM